MIQPEKPTSTNWYSAHPDLEMQKFHGSQHVSRDFQALHEYSWPWVENVVWLDGKWHCLVALVVFSFMSVGSAKYKKLARDAFRCFVKTLTLSTCDVGLEQRIKGKITAKLLSVPRLARFFYRNLGDFLAVHTKLFRIFGLFSLRNVQLLRLRFM